MVTVTTDGTGGDAGLTPRRLMTLQNKNILKPTSIQRAYQNSNSQYVCKRAKVAEWPPSLKKVCLVQEGLETPY